jgi:hypothetical protein
MTGEMEFHAFGQKTFAPTAASPGQRGAAALGFHSRPETVLLFAGALRWLICAFH